MNAKSCLILARQKAGFSCGIGMRKVAQNLSCFCVHARLRVVREMHDKSRTSRPPDPDIFAFDTNPDRASAHVWECTRTPPPLHLRGMNRNTNTSTRGACVC